MTCACTPASTTISPLSVMSVAHEPPESTSSVWSEAPVHRTGISAPAAVVAQPTASVWLFTAIPKLDCPSP
jgi:hypothetical protein